MRPRPKTPAAIAHLFTPSVLAEGQRLLVAGLVEILQAELTGDRMVVSVEVEARATFEEVSLELMTRADGEFTSWCSCGRAPVCAHVAASLMAVLEEMAQAERSKAPQWQRSLDDLLLEDREDGGTVDLCLFLSIRQIAAQEPGGSRRRALRLAARPGMRGARGSWIKGQATWHTLRRLDAAPTAVDALEGLSRLGWSSYDWYGSDEWLALDDVPAPALWAQLTAIDAAQVALVASGGAHHPVTLSDMHAVARVALSVKGSKVRINGDIDGVEPDLAKQPRWFVGGPAVAVAYVDDRDGADERITLVPFAQPVGGAARAFLNRRGAVTVDAKDRESFERDYLPRLQDLLPVVSPDGSFAVPAPPGIAFEVRVSHGDGEARVEWFWDRGATGRRRDPAREEDILRSVQEAGFDAPLAQLRNGTAITSHAFVGARAVVFVAETLPRLREIDGVRVIDTGEVPRYRAATEAPVLTVRSGDDDGTDWFDLHANVTIEGEEVDFASLFTALTLGEPVLLLPSGMYFPLDSPEFARLRAVIDEARMLGDRPVDRLRLSRYNVDLWDDLVDLGVVASQEIEWWLRVRSLSGSAEITPVPPPPGLRAELREYQRAGLTWLNFLRENGLGGILADDMGLGKTLQTIAMIEVARTADDAMAPFLIVAPTSVVGNWANECARFAPGLRIVTVTATETRRGTTIAEAASTAHIVITSYALFRIEDEQYREVTWSGLILDEAQQIKNHASRGYRVARMLGAPFTLVVTGTPMENNLLELWALASLVAPGLLGPKTQFTEFYRTPIEKRQDGERLDLLRRRLRPFLLRRTKELVAAELPPKQEKVYEIELHPAHRHLYDRRFHRERQRLLGLVDDVGGNRFEILRSLTLLRQLALDPALVDEGEAPSAKLDALDGLLVEATQEGHRVLVLSQFTRFLNTARHRAERAGLANAYLDGSTVERQKQIDRFRGGEVPVFFVSLKAGGVGLNLVEADYVVLLDPWWNPAVEEQAIDRAHRIGQTRPVIVYRMVAKGTVEEKVIALKESKARLFARVLDGGDAALTGGGFTADDIRALVE